MIFRLGWRSIWRNRRRTAITVSSIGLGLALAILFIGIGEGMYAKMIDQVVRMQAGHVTCEHPEYREAPAVDLWIDPDDLEREVHLLGPVEETKALILGQGMVKSGAGNLGASIMGVEPEVERNTSPLARNIVEGSYLESGDERLVVVGCKLARRLNVKVGKKLVIATNDIAGNLVEELCRVKGVFSTGSEEMDTYFVQIPVPFARKLYRIPGNGVTQLGVVLHDADDQGQILQKIRKMAVDNNVVVLPWQKVVPEVAAYIRMDRGSNWIFQGILLFLILFTIFNTILMSVLERQKEFSVLIALGTNPWQIRGQVLAESAFLGLIGAGVGGVLGSLLCHWVNYMQIDFSSFFPEGINVSGFAMSTILAAEAGLDVVLWPCAFVFVTTVVISLIPMERAARVKIVEELR